VSTLLAAAVSAAALAAVLIAVGASGTPATLAKLVAAAGIGVALARLLETAVELAAIAVLVAGVDAYSVAAGPTHAIVLHHQAVLGAFTLAFHPVGSPDVAQIGASDFVFFALFMAATARLGLRGRATWAAMTASLGVTMGISYVVDAALPALPLLSLAFLGANADRILQRRRRRESTA
jgi:predicted small integral membrane protein